MKLNQLLEVKEPVQNGRLTKMYPERFEGHLDCSSNQLASLEGAPVKVGGDFYCYDNLLTSLVGGPSEVSGDFYCNDNLLTSLEGAPSEVGGHFGCSSNQLASLEGAPREVGGDFYCTNNKLTSLEGVHRHLKKLGGGFWARGNPIKSHVLGLFLVDGCREVTLDNEDVKCILNKHLPEGRAGLTAAQNELIEAGLEEYAQV